MRGYDTWWRGRYEPVDHPDKGNPTRRRKGRAGTIGARLRDPNSDAPIRRILHIERAHAINDAISKLPPREAYIMIRRHGLDQEHEQTLQRIAETLGLSKERVRQLEKQAIVNLQEHLRSWKPWSPKPSPAPA